MTGGLETIGIHRVSYMITMATAFIQPCQTLSPPRCRRIDKSAQITICKGPFRIKLGDERVSLEFFRCGSLIGFYGQALFVHEIVGGRR